MKMLSRIANKLHIVSEAAKNRLAPKGTVFHITERGDWAVTGTANSLAACMPCRFRVTTCHYGMRNAVVHYGSINLLLEKRGIKLVHESNKSVVTWYHIVPGDGRVRYIADADKHVALWHTSCSLTKEKLAALGISEEKIVVVPLGVDLHYFAKASEYEKHKIREKFGIPRNKVVIGSFQKDGNGWGEGLSPKLIKGPDLFCDAVKQLAGQYEVFIVLTGPARGYIKKRLEEAGIPYLHHLLRHPHEVSEYYKALDLYIIASREEGGPKSIFESLACGIPLVTSAVGMVPDVINDGCNGLVAEIDDVDALVHKALMLIENQSMRNKLTEQGMATAQKYSWAEIAKQYYEKIYKSLM